jgi:hypothetical protein
MKSLIETIFFIERKKIKNPLFSYVNKIVIKIVYSFLNNLIQLSDLSQFLDNYEMPDIYINTNYKIRKHYQNFEFENNYINKKNKN